MRPPSAGLLLTLLQVLPAHAQGAARQTGAGQLIVGLELDADLDEMLVGTEIVPLASINGTSIHLLQLPRGASPLQQAAAITRLGADPRVRFVERNSRVNAPEAAACSQIGGGASGQPCTEAVVDGNPTTAEFYDQTMVSRLNVPAAQQLLSGFPTLVAVIDTGMDLSHPLFQGRLFSTGHDLVLDRPFALDEANGRDDDGDGAVDEGFGHGTHVAGIIALINPEALLLPLRVLDSDGNGTAFNVARAIYEAASAGADVINLSLAMAGPSQAVVDALTYVGDNGIDVLAAAGNSGSAVLFPARAPGVVAVAAVDDQDLRADFSAFGPEVGLSAPGVGLLSAYPGNRYAWWSGTSMACAVASGSASLTASVAADNQNLAPSEALLSSCVSIDALNPVYSGLLGNGRLDAYGAALVALQVDPDQGDSSD